MTLAEAMNLLDHRLAHFEAGRLVPAPEPVPPDVLEDAMLGFLRKVADRSPPLRFGYRYRCAEQLLLHLARPVRANFDAMQIRPMRAGECFDNAFAVSQCGVWRYTEGYALMDGAAEPVHHAWLTGPNGEIEDPTWRLVIERKRSKQPNRVWSGDVVYLGLTVDAGPHRAWNERTLYPNLLSVYDDEIDETIAMGPQAWFTN